MKPTNFKHQNKILKAPLGAEDDVSDLPVCETFDAEGKPLVISVWELSDADIELLVKTRRLNFMCWGHTHPPVCLSAQDFFSDGQ